MTALPILLETAIEMNMIALKQKGGPDDTDINKARAAADTIAENGDALEFSGSSLGVSTGQVFNELAFALAVARCCNCVPKYVIETLYGFAKK
jgi:hypothetical protein